MTKAELKYLAFLCKSEVDSMGRIAAGILRVLKLESKIGHGVISQLSNLGKFFLILFGTSFLITKIEVSTVR